jgi:hypothetical protein
MEGYGNFPVSSGPCRAATVAKADTTTNCTVNALLAPPFQPLAFSLQHLPSPRQSNPVKPSQTTFLRHHAFRRPPAARKNRVALAPAFTQHPPMLARVSSAAVNGIEAFPSEAEVHF